MYIDIKRCVVIVITLALGFSVAIGCWKFLSEDQSNPIYQYQAIIGAMIASYAAYLTIKATREVAEQTIQATREESEKVVQASHRQTRSMEKQHNADISRLRFDSIKENAAKVQKEINIIQVILQLIEEHHAEAVRLKQSLNQKTTPITASVVQNALPDLKIFKEYILLNTESIEPSIVAESIFIVEATDQLKHGFSLSLDTISITDNELMEETVTVFNSALNFHIVKTAELKKNCKEILDNLI